MLKHISRNLGSSANNFKPISLQHDAGNAKHAGEIQINVRTYRSGDLGGGSGAIVNPTTDDWK